MAALAHVDLGFTLAPRYATSSGSILSWGRWRGWNLGGVAITLFHERAHTCPIVDPAFFTFASRSSSPPELEQSDCASVPDVGGGRN